MQIVDHESFSSPELDPASEVLRRPPLEADHPHGGRLAAVCDRGLEPLAAVKVLRLGEVAAVRQVGDVPRAHPPLRLTLSPQEEALEGSPAPESDPEVSVTCHHVSVHHNLHWWVSGLGGEPVSGNVLVTRGEGGAPTKPMSGLYKDD